MHTRQHNDGRITVDVYVYVPSAHASIVNYFVTMLTSVFHSNTSVYWRQHEECRMGKGWKSFELTVSIIYPSLPDRIAEAESETDRDNRRRDQRRDADQMMTALIGALTMFSSAGGYGVVID